MPINKNSERRQYPRIQAKIPLKLAADGYDFITATQNVSCIGAYCRIDKYVPPFTKVSVKMTLPLAKGRKEEDSSVECKGVVVRSEGEGTSGFNIAVFFNEIKESQRKKISRYLNQFLPEKSPQN